MTADKCFDSLVLCAFCVYADANRVSWPSKSFSELFRHVRQSNRRFNNLELEIVNTDLIIAKKCGILLVSGRSPHKVERWWQAMNKKVTVRVDSKGRITLPKEAREYAEIDEGDILFLDIAPGKMELTRAVRDPIVTLRDYAQKEYEEGRTRDLRDYAKEKGIPLDE